MLPTLDQGSFGNARQVWKPNPSLQFQIFALERGWSQGDSSFFHVGSGFSLNCTRLGMENILGWFRFVMELVKEEVLMRQSWGEMAHSGSAFPGREGCKPWAVSCSKLQALSWSRPWALS